MSKYTLYYKPSYIRPITPILLAKYFKADIQLVNIDDEATKFWQEFPEGLSPALLGPNGFHLVETIAVNNFIVKTFGTEEEARRLLGSDVETESKILQWESVAVSDLLTREVGVVGPFIGKKEYDADTFARDNAKFDAILKVFETRLTTHEYLVGDHVTAADLTCGASFYLGFLTYFGEEWRGKYPRITAWYRAVTGSEYFKDHFKDQKFLETAPRLPK